MAVVSLDALAQRRELNEARAELEDLRRRHKRTENALAALRDVLSGVPVPVEVIAEDLLIHFANRASRDRYGEQIEGTPYYRTLLGKDSPPESCPVLTTLRDNREVRLDGIRDGAPVEVILTPTVLSGGQRAVVRTTQASAETPVKSNEATTPVETAPTVVAARPSGDALDTSAATLDTSTSTLDLVRDIASLREVASIVSRTLNTGRLFKLLLPVLAERLDAEVVLYYKCDHRALRFALQGAITPDVPSSPPEVLDRDDFTALRNTIHIDAPYLHIKSVADANALPEPIRDYLLRASAAEALLIPARSPIARYGTLVIARSQSRPAVTADHDRLLTALAQLLGSAIERNNVVRTLRNNVTTVMDLQRAGMEVTSAADIQSVFERFARTALRVLEFDAAKVRVAGLTGMPPGGSEGVASSFPGPFPLDENLSAQVAEASARALESGEIELIDADTPLRIVVDTSHESQLVHCKTVTMVPLHVGERIHGIVQLFGPHSREDIISMKPVLKTLVDHVAAALHQCERAAEVNRRLENVAGEERLSIEILDAMDHAVAVIDSTGEVIQTNHTLRAMTGCTTSRAPRLRDIVFSGSRSNEVNDRELAQGLFERAPLTGNDCYLTSSSGERIPTEMSASPVGRGADKLLLVFKDVRAEREMKKRLVDALGLSLAGEHIASLAHQVNNYLQPAFYHTEVLGSNMLLDTKTRQAVSTIHNYLHLCHESILMVLQFIRPAVPTALDMNELIDEMLTRQYFASDLSTERAVIVRDFDEHLPITLGYRIQLQEALCNVIKNAQEAIIESGWGGRVTVTTEATPATITIRIADDGPGMPDHILGRVFDFGVSGKVSGKGTGVGMHFAREIVRKHRGTISVESAAGAGTTFEIRIPVKDPDSFAADATTPASRERCSLQRPDGPAIAGRILIIDDEPAILELVNDILAPDHHEVTVAKSAAEALTALRKDEFDCIICDVKMPEMDGRMFSKLIKERHPEIYDRLVFATGDIFCNETDGFIRESGIPCVAKPFTAERLQDAVQYVLANAAPHGSTEQRINGTGG